MSYTEISDQFETISSNLKKGNQVISALCNFFKNYKKLIDNYNQQQSKLCDTLVLDFPKEGNVDTLSTALHSFISFLRKQNQSQLIFSKNLQLDIIEPLELFINHFATSTTSLSNQGAAEFKELSKCKDRLEKSMNKYIQASEIAEKSEKLISVDDSKEKQEKALKQFLGNRAMANKESDRYMIACNKMNGCLDEYNSVMPGIMQCLQQNEVGRIHFLKYTLEKYGKHYIAYHNVTTESLDDMTKILSNVNSDIDIRVLVDRLKSKSSEITKTEFITYEKWKETNKIIEETLPKEEETAIEEQVDPNYELIRTVLNFLTQDIMRRSIESSSDSDASIDVPAYSIEEELDQSYFTKLSNILREPEGRILFCDVLEHMKHRNSLTSEKILQLAAIINSLLTVIMMENDKDPMIFSKIIVSSHIFYTEKEDGKRVYLSNYISTHTIWNDKSRWIQAIDYTTQVKIASDKTSMQRIKSLKRKNEGLFGTIKTLANKLPMVFQKGGDEQTDKSAAFMVMTQFSFHMIHLAVPLETANAIIMSFSQKINLDADRTCVLLAELQANQRNILKEEAPWKISKKKREKERRKWGEILPIGLALKFLTQNETFNLILVCKHWKLRLYPTIVKKWLYKGGLGEEFRLKIRTKVWSELLKDDMPSSIDYIALLNKVIAEPTAINELEEIIDMDVSRCYQNHPHIIPQVLKNLLKTYAYYNPEIGYCQGMNYIAGTLYIQIQDEETTFRSLISLVKRFKMTNLFINDLPKLKQFFYQMDRLIGILEPEVHEYFKEVGISSGHFSSPWFITLFASHLQNKTEVLLQIWDLFLIQGWKAIFKAGISIISRLSKEIIGSRFEDIMQLLTSLNVNIANIDVFDEEFIERVKMVKISDALLQELEFEYENLKIRASERKK